MRYIVMGPDRIPNLPCTYPTIKAAEKAKKQFIERFRRQGYYSTCGLERIPFDELPNHVHIVEDK